MILSDDGPFLAHGNDSRLDLETQFLHIRSEFVYGGQVHHRAPHWHSIYLHENSHWARYHGSTLGVALTAFQQASHDIILTGLRYLETGELKALLRARREGRPIFDIDDLPVIGSQEISDLRISWLADRIGYYLLFNSQALEQVRFMDHGVAAGWAIADGYVASMSLLGLPPRDPTRDLIEYTPEVGHLETAFGRLTTRDLFECAAAIDQIASLSGLQKFPQFPTTRDAADSAINVLLSTRYGLPLDLYLAVAEPEESGGSSIISTLLGLIDFALNPPLPPAVPYEDLARASWIRLDPASRFLLGCSAVRDMPQLSAVPEQGELRSFHQRLATRLEWPDIYSYDGALAVAAQRQQVSLDDSGEKGLPTYAYPRVLGDVQARFWGLRLRHPEFISHNGYISTHYSTASLNYMFGEEHSGWFMAPIVIEDGELNSVVSWDDERLAEYFSGLAIRVMARHVVGRVGRIPSDLLPLREKSGPFWQAIGERARDLNIFGLKEFVTDILPSD